MFPRVWVKVFILLGLFFYWPLSQVSTVCMLLLGIVCLISFYLLQQIFSYPLLYLFVLTFVLSGIGLFIGYRIEDKKPAFMQKIFFFLIGPIWILQYLGVKVSD